MTDQTNPSITLESAAAVVAALTETHARIQQLALDQLGDWLGVDPVHQPAAIHHWQEVYDLAASTTAPAYSDGQVRLINKVLRQELDEARAKVEALRQERERAEAALADALRFIWYTGFPEDPSDPQKVACIVMDEIEHEHGYGVTDGKMYKVGETHHDR